MKVDACFKVVFFEHHPAGWCSFKVNKIYKPNIFTIMKKIQYKDFEGDTFSAYEILVYGILVPVGFVLAIGMVGFLAKFF